MLTPFTTILIVDNNLYRKYMGKCLVVSIIIRTFVLSVVNTEDGFGGMSLAEGRLQPAF